MGSCHTDHRRKSHRHKHKHKKGHSTRKVKKGTSKRFGAKKGGSYGSPAPQTPTGAAPAPAMPATPQAVRQKKEEPNAPSPSGNILANVGNAGRDALTSARNNLMSLFDTAASQGQSGGRKKTKHKKHARKSSKKSTKKYKGGRKKYARKHSSKKHHSRKHSSKKHKKRH